ncbi:MAG: hypothetical protein NkDv07_0743 [Candidatus Improbicoccus devescovinae]|nr:MAG: hypothetical protein NkDv07_0743 [Candidatus Improbicoccus devescovinae]
MTYFIVQVREKIQKRLKDTIAEGLDFKKVPDEEEYYKILKNIEKFSSKITKVKDAERKIGKLAKINPSKAKKIKELGHIIYSWLGTKPNNKYVNKDNVFDAKSHGLSKAFALKKTLGAVDEYKKFEKLQDIIACQFVYYLFLSLLMPSASKLSARKRINFKRFINTLRDNKYRPLAKCFDPTQTNMATVANATCNFKYNGKTTAIQIGSHGPHELIATSILEDLKKIIMPAKFLRNFVYITNSKELTWLKFKNKHIQYLLNLNKNNHEIEIKPKEVSGLCLVFTLDNKSEIVDLSPMAGNADKKIEDIPHIDNLIKHVTNKHSPYLYNYQVNKNSVPQPWNKFKKKQIKEFTQKTKITLNPRPLEIWCNNPEIKNKSTRYWRWWQTNKSLVNVVHEIIKLQYDNLNKNISPKKRQTIDMYINDQNISLGSAEYFDYDREKHASVEAQLDKFFSNGRSKKAELSWTKRNKNVERILKGIDIQALTAKRK